MKINLKRPAEFDQEQERIIGSIHQSGKHMGMLPPVGDPSSSLVLNTGDVTNPIPFSDWGESLGTYELDLKPLLDFIATCWSKKQTNLLISPPFYLKPWRGLAPHPFPNSSTKCWEITVPPTSEYYTPVDGSLPIAVAVQKVNNDEKQKVESDLDRGEGLKDLSDEDQGVARMLEQGEDFKGRGIVRLIITDDYNWYCISLFHNYIEGSDQRCIFSPNNPLPLWREGRKKPGV